jgi:hypothetical protein
LKASHNQFKVNIAKIMKDAKAAASVREQLQAKQKAFQAVNTTLIDHYWQVGKIISQKIKSA